MGMEKKIEKTADDFSDRPIRTSGSLIVKGGVILFMLAIVLGTVGAILGWFGEAADVARKELGPKSLLKKYEWFKDAAAQLNKKRADIKVYESRISAMKNSYGDEPRSKWDRTDKEQINQWYTESAGVKASYNSLAADYNAQMAKVNWRFCNTGEVPKGGDPLPRDFPEYLVE